MFFSDGFSWISLDACVRLGSRLLWCKILSVCFRRLQRGHLENPYERAWGRPRFRAWWKCGRFHHQKPLDKGTWTPRSPGVCADAQCCKITWLEELASESNTIQAQEDISVSGKIAGNMRPKLYVFLWWFFFNISGLVNSFGLSSCVVQENISLLHWIAAGSSRKSIWEWLIQVKVSRMMIKMTYFMLRGR